MTGPAPAFTHHDRGTPEYRWVRAGQWSGVEPLSELTAPALSRVVVVAAHPDDETLGAGGLIRVAADRGLDVHLVLLTAGEASHPDSPTHDPDRLAALRVEESRQALAALAPVARLTVVGIADGGVEQAHATALEAVVDAVGEQGGATLVVAPWRHDGHPDHEAAGHVAALAAARTDATLVEYPIWLWHWGTEGDAPWGRMRRLDLGPDVAFAKRAALDLHTTQVQPLSDRPGDEVLLDTGFVDHFRRDWEVFLTTDEDTDEDTDEETVDDAFERLHRAEADPWGVRTRWYEQRKRDVTLAALPRQRFRRVLEVGCSVGQLATDLAGRCDELVAVDRSEAAVGRCSEALAHLPHASVHRATVPAQWPEGEFDLVVVSEIGYFLSPRELAGLVGRVRDCLTPDGALLLCHWRHPISGWPLGGDRVHEAVGHQFDRPLLVQHIEADFRLDVWGREPADGA